MSDREKTSGIIEIKERHAQSSSGAQSLWLLIVFAAMVLVLQFRPIHDTDIFWQRKLGSLSLERGEFVTRSHSHQRIRMN